RVLGRNGLDCGRSLRKRNTRRETSDRQQPAIVTAPAVLRRERQGKPGFGGHRIGESLLHQADNGVALSFHFDVFAENFWVGGEALFPKRVTQNDLLVLADFFFVGQESTAHGRRHADRLEEIGGDVHGLNFLRRGVSGE